jgi:hypothetical protein
MDRCLINSELTPQYILQYYSFHANLLLEQNKKSESSGRTGDGRGLQINEIEWSRSNEKAEYEHENRAATWTARGRDAYLGDRIARWLDRLHGRCRLACFSKGGWPGLA